MPSYLTRKRLNFYFSLFGRPVHDDNYNLAKYGLTTSQWIDAASSNLYHKNTREEMKNNMLANQDLSEMLNTPSPPPYDTNLIKRLKKNRHCEDAKKKNA